LAVAKEWERPHPRELSADEAEFLRRSLEAQQQREASELETAQKFNKKLRGRAILAIVFATVALIFGLIALFEARRAGDRAAFAEELAERAEELAKRAEEQARIAESRRLAEESAAVLAKYPQRSLLLAVEAAKIGQTPHGERVAAAEQSLREALAHVGGRLLGAAAGPITAVAISRTTAGLSPEARTRRRGCGI
jgi:hypothetical protein